MTSGLRRAPFIFPTLPSTWYIGHMSRALKEMQHMIKSQKIDLLIETRDSRLPLTSINPVFEKLLNLPGKEDDGNTVVKRLIVYNKSDLAQFEYQKPLIDSITKHTKQPVIFTDSRSDASIKDLMKLAIKLADRPLEGPEDRITMLIAGMPNTGKSSILNALRRVGVKKGKAASVSSSPGHTRRLSTFIKISLSPPIYIHDTPGIMIPYFGKGIKGDEMALKLALTGGIKESLFEGETVGDYLVWRLRGRFEDPSWKEDGVTRENLMESLQLSKKTSLDSSYDFLLALADRLNAVQKGGEPDLDFAGKWLLQAFRDGKLGRWTLDGLGRGGEAVDLDPNAQISKLGSSSLKLEERIDEVVKSHLEGIKKLDLSGHQEKKKAKADQAQLRMIKKEAFQVVQPKTTKGPRGAGIQSARRRVFRRH